MVSIQELRPSTVEALKKAYSDKKEIVDHMAKRGNVYERAIAVVILQAAEVTEGD